MFILRKITSENVEINISLGESYTLITEEINEHEFNQIREEGEDECIFAYIICRDGELALPISNLQTNYILTESGKIFDIISE